jgi:molybdate transport system ATP-binding protein
MTGGDLEVEVRARLGAFVLNVALEAAAGEVVALVGPNGAGKSTTLACVAGAVRYEGSVRVGGHPLEGIPTERRRVGMVFQDHLLFPHLTVLENVAFGPRSAGVDRDSARRHAGEWLDRLGLAGLGERRTGTLSGGQSQRVALARALATEPDVLLLDEPLAALDIEVRAGVRAELRAHLSGFAGATVLVTHSFADVDALAHSVTAIEGGRVVQSGPPAELARHPSTPWVASFTTARA